MKHIALALSIALLTPACSTIPANGSIEQVNRATLKAGITIASTYTAASKTGEKLVAAGLLDKAKFKALDAKAFGIVQDFRAGKLVADVAFAQINAITLEMVK